MDNRNMLKTDKKNWQKCSLRLWNCACAYNEMCFNLTYVLHDSSAIKNDLSGAAVMKSHPGHLQPFKSPRMWCLLTPEKKTHKALGPPFSHPKFETVNVQYQNIWLKTLNRFFFTLCGSDSWAWHLKYILHCPTASALRCTRCIPAQASQDSHQPARPQPVRCLIGTPQRQAWAAWGSGACRWSSHPVLHKTFKQIRKKTKQANSTI